MKNLYFIIVLALFTPLSKNGIFAQNNGQTKWWKPSDSPFLTVEGQYWTNEMHDSLFRLPPRAEALVRKPVWNFLLDCILNFNDGFIFK